MGQRPRLVKDLRKYGPPYSIIYADPPWEYRDKANAGERGAVHKYPVMKLADIKALPVGDIVAENAALFLWATMPLLPDCLEVIDAWGFKYKTVGFTWVKTNPKSGGYFMGGGSWTRANAELCLLAFKGKMKRISASVRSVVESNLRAHSEKPPEVRGRIVELLGNLPRIELFARKRFGGWHGWGNEVEFNNIELADNEFVWRGKP